MTPYPANQSAGDCQALNSGGTGAEPLCLCFFNRLFETRQIFRGPQHAQFWFRQRRPSNSRAGQI